jgi:ABC-2 type transport system ATP-binding protein
MEPQVALKIDNLIKTFKKDSKDKDGATGNKGILKRLGISSGVQTRVVDSINLEVKRGEIFGILGPNGSGKSTIIRIISTLLLPDGGTAAVFGHDVVNEADKVRRIINRVSADAAFFRRLSAMENLMHTARLYELPLDEAKDRIKKIMDRLDLEKEKLDSPMHELSRGMQQKVAIARAFLTSPVLMLLDEPSTGLDPKSKREVQKFIKQIQKDHDATVLLTTHDMEEAELLCDRIAIIDKGKIAALGTPAELKEMCVECDTQASMEDVFIHLTGRKMEEGEES